jgi:hypothetical protein
MLEAYEPQKDDLPQLLYMRRGIFKTDLIRKPVGNNSDEDSDDNTDDTDDQEYKPTASSATSSRPIASEDPPKQRKDLRPKDILNKWGRRDAASTPAEIPSAVQSLAHPAEPSPPPLSVPPPPSMDNPTRHPPRSRQTSRKASRQPSTRHSSISSPASPTPMDVDPIVPISNQPILSNLRSRSGARQSPSTPRRSNAFDPRAISTLQVIQEFNDESSFFSQAPTSPPRTQLNPADISSTSDSGDRSSSDIQDLLNSCMYSLYHLAQVSLVKRFHSVSDRHIRPYR